MRYWLDLAARPLTDVRGRDAAIEELRKALLKASKYTCIHEREKKSDEYCDGCPCLDLPSRLACPLKKNFSK